MLGVRARGVTPQTDILEIKGIRRIPSFGVRTPGVTPVSLVSGVIRVSRDPEMGVTTDTLDTTVTGVTCGVQMEGTSE
jgi:hypothetical protein